jgi:hypothetical protein
MLPVMILERVSEAEAREALDKVLRSRTFERSERLQRFLRYVCELTLRGEGSRINEYLIGAEVFERGPDYSPQEDAVVRRQAHALRRKLHEYYETEGRADPVRIELPLGRYVPVFRRAEERIHWPMAAPGKPAPQEARWPLATAMLAGALVFLAGLWAGRYATATDAGSTAARIPPAVREIWGPWLDDPAGVVICFSNPLTAVIKHLPVPHPDGVLPRRLRLRGEAEQWIREEFRLPPGGYLYFAPAKSQGKMGEAIGAVHLANLFARAGVAVHTTQSRFLTWEDLRSQNLILLGHNEANAWVDPLLESYPFRLTATHGARQRAIVNTQPAPGEPRDYFIAYSDASGDRAEEFALVSMLPGVDGRRKLLLVNGLNTQATQAAIEYLTSPSRLSELLQMLRRQAPGHNRPWHFQLVLRTQVRDKVPTRATPVALRLIRE